MSFSPRSGAERRRHRRFEVRDVRGSFPLKFHVRVLNMSLTGLAVESVRPLEIGTDYELTLQADNERVELRAEVRWSQLVRTERCGHDVVPVYQSGLDFRNALEKRTRELLAVLQHHIEFDAERRISGRFNVSLIGTAKVTKLHEFRVLVISLSGMMIETDLPLEIETALDLGLRFRGRNLRIAGRVTNLQAAPDAARSRAGVAFEKLDPEIRQAPEEMATSFLDKETARQRHL